MSAVGISKGACLCGGSGREAVAGGEAGVLKCWGVVWEILSMGCFFIISHSDKSNQLINPGPPVLSQTQLQ